MAIYGYARASSKDQDTAIQVAALKAKGCEVIRSEKLSGTTRQGRDELATLMQFMRRGDTLMVTRIDRLARSLGDLQDIARELEAKGVDLKATDQAVDTSSPSGRAFFNMLGVFAQFETELRKERQSEGIARAKALGVYHGRKATLDASAVQKLKGEGLGATEISKRLNISRASVYRFLRETELPEAA